MILRSSTRNDVVVELGCVKPVLWGCCEFLFVHKVAINLAWVVFATVNNRVARHELTANINRNMAKLTKSQITNEIAEGADISKAQAKAVLETIASLAYANAKDGFTLPGLGKVSVRQSAPRTMVMRFGPREGETINVPAKTKLKFTYLKAAKEAILG